MTEIVSELRVYSRHLRAARICAKGARSWWDLQGFDYSDFRTNGILASTLTATGDALALKVVAIAEAERDGR